MKLKAREVWEDCNLALEMLENEQDLQKWRITWAAAMALVRAVGNVLQGVDSENKIIKEISDGLFKEWKSDEAKHLIFWEFIKKDRDNLLKEYRENVHPLEKVAVVVQSVLQPIKGGAPALHNAVFEIDENIYRPVMEGPWAGDDARDVLQEALNWWNEQLTAIEKQYADKVKIKKAK